MAVNCSWNTQSSRANASPYLFLRPITKFFFPITTVYVLPALVPVSNPFFPRQLVRVTLIGGHPATRYTWLIRNYSERIHECVPSFHRKRNAPTICTITTGASDGLRKNSWCTLPRRQSQETAKWKIPTRRPGDTATRGFSSQTPQGHQLVKRIP